jgi:hypothetical protein
MATPTGVLLARIATLLSTDTGSLAPAALACKIHLTIAPFSPGPLLTVASFTEATFAGYAALSAGTGAQESFNDPPTGQRIIQLLEPAGGWHWQATTAVGLPQTVYGWYVTDNASAVLWGSALLPAPITLAAAADGVDISVVRFGLVPSALV